MINILKVLFIAFMMTSTNAFGFGLSWSNNKIRKISLLSQMNINQSFPVQIDLIFVMDENLSKAETFLNMTNEEFYRDRQMLFMQYSKTQLLVAPYETVSGEMVEEITLPKNFKKAFRVLVFSNFMDKTETPEPIDISNIKKPLIKIDGSKIEIKNL